MMTIVEMLRTWGSDQDAFQTVQLEAESPDSWTAQLRTTESSVVPGLDLNVWKRAGEERIWISFEETLPAELASFVSTAPETAEILPRLISAVNDTRAGSVTCAMRMDDAVPTLEIRAILYQDGLSRHTLNMAVLEIVKSYNSIRQRYDEVVRALGLMVQHEEEWKSEMQSSLRCHSCNATNPPASRFCNQCGASLGCPSCGAKNPAGSRFCNQCGTSLVGRSPSAS